MTVHKKLMQARVKLLDTKLEKSGHNKFAGYKYFELGDFLPPTTRIFNELGLCGVITFTTEYATLNITDVDDGSMIVITSPMAHAELKGAHDIQNLGACETYQRRYLWSAAMELTENDPIDATAGSEPPPKPKAEHKPKAPPVIEGKPGEWQIKIESKTDDIDVWADVVIEAAVLLAETAKEPQQVTKIYQVNKTIMDALKEARKDRFDQLMLDFKNIKDKLTEAQNG